MELFNSSYIRGADVIKDEDLGKETEHFLFQAYSYNAVAFDLSFEVTTLQRLIHRESLRIEPGFNQYVVPLRISTQPYRRLVESKDMLLARIIPQGDFEAHFVVLMAEFANLDDGLLDRTTQDSARRGAMEGSTSSNQVKSIPPKSADKVKCVCWDLDNTVWDGTLIEADPAALKLRPRVRETMEELDRRGIVQMVVSKNQEEEARPVLERLGISDLFVYTFINWNSKSDNVRRIAELLNINIDTFAFIDDQPFERAEVGETLPCVRVYAETDVPALLDSLPFDVPVTQDGASRRAMYQTEARRRETQQGFSGNNIDFIRSCELEIEISLPETDAQRVRSYELVQRTNQLNLSGKRYEADVFASMISGSQAARTVCITCKDRFGLYGQVGYVVLSLHADVLYVSEFALSCRVMGKCVENALAAWLKSLARANGAVQVVLKGVRTERNALIMKTFEAVGFEDAALFEGDIVLCSSTETPTANDDVVRIIDHASCHLTKDGMRDAQLVSKSSCEVLAFVPHQDDEVLTLGVGIAGALRKTKGRVAVILCTDGTNCETRLWLNDGKSCSDLNDLHHYEFSKEEYGLLRDEEFIESCKTLGVPESAIRFVASRAVDGCLSVEGARNAIMSYIRLYPGAMVLTHAPIEPVEDMSAINIADSEPGGTSSDEHLIKHPDGTWEWAPQHRDHRVLGQATLELYREGLIGVPELFVEFYHRQQFTTRFPHAALALRCPDESDAVCVENAVRSYGIWDPNRRRFALGLHSARGELTSIGQRPVGYSCLPVLDGKGGCDFVSASRVFDQQLASCECAAMECAHLRADVQVLQETCSSLRMAADEIANSTTYRIGKAIMAFPCALKDRFHRG
ncbi:MAG: HAD-IIIC family phosphatase [Raoultibacter sp.]